MMDIVHMLWLLCLTDCVTAGDNCMTWSIVKNNLQLTCRVKHYEQSVKIVDSFYITRASCNLNSSKPDCSAMSLYDTVTTDAKTKEIVLKIPVLQIKKPNVNGRWICVQGDKMVYTYVSLEDGIMNDTKMYLSGSIFNVYKDVLAVKLNCFSCTEPRKNIAEFLINKISEDTVKYNRNTNQCSHQHGVCYPEICTCSSSGNEFTRVFNIRKINESTTFSCHMIFADDFKSSIFSKSTTVRFNGKDFIMNGTETRVIKKPVYTTTNTPNVPGHNDSKTAAVFKWTIIGLTIFIILAFCFCTLVILKTTRKSKITRSKLDIRMTENTHLLEANQWHENVDEKHCEECFKGKALYWCFVCQQSLCIDCKNYQKSLTVTDNHLFIEIANLPKQYISSVFCSTHQNLKCSYFCADHDCLFCNECTMKHKACPEIRSVAVASKDVKQSKNIKNYKNRLNRITTDLNDFLKNRTSNITSIERDVAAIYKTVNETEYLCIDLEVKTIKADLEEKKTIILNKIREDISKGKENLQIINQQMSVFEFMITFGTKKQLFLLMHLSKQEIKEIEQSCKELIAQSKLFHLQMNESQVIEQIEYKDKSISDKSKLISHFSDLDRSLYTFTKQNEFELNDTNENEKIGSCLISSMTVSNSGLLLLCDCISPRILVFDLNGLNRGQIDMDFEPWDIAIIPGGNKAVVTCSGYDCIQFVNIATFKYEHMVEKEGIVECGIACTEEYILVGSWNKIFILNHWGIQVKVIENISDIDAKFHYVSHHEGRISVGFGSNIIHCFNLDDKSKVFQCHAWNLVNPNAIVSDKEGNVLVLGRDSNNIIMLDREGKCVDIPLEKEDGLLNSRAMCFNENCSKLYVSNINKSILVWKIEKRDEKE